MRYLFHIKRLFYQTLVCLFPSVTSSRNPFFEEGKLKQVTIDMIVVEGR